MRRQIGDIAGASKWRQLHMFGPHGAALTDGGRGRLGITLRTQAAPSAARCTPQEHFTRN
jgi:hypothetical protein